MATPQEIIERIRRQEYLIGVELPPEVEEGARNMRLNLNNALKTLSEDLYSKETHFVLELVQNADDNDYAPGVDPEISFLFSPARLLVQNNEVGFTEANVAALCKVGQTTKEKRTGFIGEKGIGFKSVFTATDHPEIHSNGFHFGFDRVDPSHVLGYVVPHWCGDAGYPQDRTTIVLPAKEGAHFTEEKLAQLTDELLLFLRKLRTIAIADETGETKRVYKRTDESGIVTLTSETFEAGSDTPTVSQRRFRHFQHAYPTAEIKEEKRQGIEEAVVVLAFPITDDGVASAGSTQNVCAFLPVRDYGFRFLIQGDFLLSSNREDVHKSPAWNKRVRDEVSKAFMSAISVFKTDSLLSFTFLQYVPRKGDVTDIFFAGAAEKIAEDLKSTECILSASGAWLRPKDVIVADEEFKALFPNDDLKRILGLEYLSSEVDVPQATLERLGVLNAGVQNHLFALIEKDDRLAERPISWFRALYRYCDRKVTGEPAIKKFQSLAATKLDGGRLVKLTDTKIYFPLQRGGRFGFEHELALLHPELVSKGDGADEVARFLSRVGVKVTEPYSLIVHHILPKHASGGDWAKSDRSALVGHIAYIKEHMSEYLKGAAAAGESTAALTTLREGLYLQSKKVVDGMTYFARPGEMYLGTEYRPTVPLERLLGLAESAIKFVAAVYLSPPAGGTGDDEETGDRRAWREFFYQIGVNPYPAVNDQGLGMNYSASSELIALVTSEDPKRRKSIIEIIDRHWTYYSRFLEARSTPRRGYSTTSASQFLQLLRGMKAPSSKRGDFTLGETYRDIDYVRAVFGASAAYLDADVTNTDFLDAVGVTHRVDAAACVKRLDQLRSAERTNNKDVKLIYRELERLFDKEETLIKAAFAEAPRIYVHALGKWFNLDDVVWESSGAFIDRQFPPLQFAYREHQTFFRNNLKVSKQPTESALIQAMAKLEEYGQTHAERRAEALKIYRRLARSFGDEEARNPGSEPSWLGDLRTKAVFLDQSGRLVDVSNDIYIGDDLRLADAFKAHERISLLDVEHWLVPQLEDLLAKCGMQRLSAVAKYELTTVDGAVLDGELTRRVRHRSNHIMRVIYARAHRAFERANRQGLWKDLASLEVATVAVLEVEADVHGYRVGVRTDTYLHEHTIYLVAGARGKYDKLAQEVCSYLGIKPDEVSESIYRVLTASGEDELQDFFEVKGIADIPHDELEILLESEQQSRSAELEAPQVHRAEGAEETQEDAIPAETVKAPEDPPATPPRADTPAHGLAMQPTSPVGQSLTAGTLATDASESTPSTSLVPRRKESDRRSSGRLLSYAEPALHPERDTANDISHEERLSIAKAAVDFVLELERGEGRDVVEMPFTNEGFDILRRSEGAEEYIEVKGVRGAWGAEGIVVTPPELRMAERQNERFWLYVVEYAMEPLRRRLYKIQDPFGKTNQFRFDSGWKGVVAGAADVMSPAEGRRVSIEGLGAGTILSVTEAGVLRRLSIRLDSGEEVTRTYDTTKMTISAPV